MAIGEIEGGGDCNMVPGEPLYLPLYKIATGRSQNESALGTARKEG